MCGRFTSTTPAAELAEYFGVNEVVAPELGARFNVAPTDETYAVAASSDGSRRLGTFRWGLVPFWAKDATIGAKMINARAETLLEKPAFRRPFERRRCIVPADGFYEWARPERGARPERPSERGARPERPSERGARPERPSERGAQPERPSERGAHPGQPKKQPWYITRADGRPMAFAGLWESWRPVKDSDEGRVRSCVIITGAPNDAVARLHDRMPVILPPAAWDEWLDAGNHDVDALRALLVPVPAGDLRLVPVSTAVNNVRNDGPELVEPLPAEPNLFSTS